VCGRWVSLDVLARLSRRAQGPTPPSRRVLVADFCRAIGWRDAKGRLSVSSASVALRKLEKQGRVQLPPVTPRARGAQARGLSDDGKPLPPLPKFLRARGGMTGLRLRLIQDAKDPAHAIWNRLVVREHELGRRPLVGAQLRYLIECDQGILGAIGFGPPAYHLACRDAWIGWALEAHEQNRGWVINLARFLLRPGLRVPQLATQCYGLVLGQVAQDWHARYGVKPVLVETFVDQTRHDGRSLAAANWRRLGESKGRGRNDPKRAQAQSAKDVWLYELDPHARTKLQASQAPVLAPRSVFAPTLADDWAEEEMAGLDLGDQRLNRRAPRMLRSRWARPQHSFYRSFETPAECKAAYQLVENQRAQINLDSLLAPHQLQTARRMAAEKVVLLAQDTCTLGYNSLEQTEGLGTICEDHGHGLFLHSMQAFRLDGIPLGTAWSEIWARTEESDSDERKQQSIDEKESGRWLRAVQAGGQRARQMPQTCVIVCGDRESDIYEVYDQVQDAPPNLFVLVRGKHDRYLTNGERLLDSLAASPLGGLREVKLPRRSGVPARTAILELRWQEVELQPPAVGLKRTWPPLKLYAVLAREVDAPEGVEPIDWLLLTNVPVTTLKMARRAVRWYALRWGIECWHKVLKVVCGVERRQLKTALALERALAMDMIVSSRVLLLSRLGKEHPDLPAELFYSPAELEVLEIKKKETRKFLDHPRLTVLQANILVAMIVGFLGRKGDGHPGAQILAEGLRALGIAVWAIRGAKLTRADRRRGAPT